LSEPPLDELQQRLECNGGGLESTDTQPRLAKFGYNELTEENVNRLLTFLS
jgi:hypothetical protein